MKSTFLVVLIVCSFCCGIGSLSARNKKTMPKEQRIELGVWEDADKTASVDSIIRWMKPLDEVGIKNYYICGSLEEVLRYLTAAKSYSNVKIHAWIFAVNVPRDSVALSHPEWFEVNRMGYNSYEYDPYVKHYKWLSPAVPEARQYIKQKVASYAALEGLTSVHLDFIRYNDAVLGRRLQLHKFKIQQDTYRAEYDFGYHPLAIAKFKKQFGYSPLDLQAPWMSPEWLQFRLNEVTTLVNEIVEEVHAQGKQVSAAVFPYPTRARMTVYQDWPTWKIDIVCPMNYQSFYSEDFDWITFSVENGLRETFHKNKYISGLFVPDITTEELYKAAKLSIQAGADGVNFFNARALLRDGKLEAVKQINMEYNLPQK